MESQGPGTSPGTHVQEHTRTYFLGKLAEEVQARGLDASLKPNPPVLRVSDPRAGLLTETVDCVAMADDDGRPSWFYRWSWGDLVHRADQPVAAAEKILRVLAP